MPIENNVTVSGTANSVSRANEQQNAPVARRENGGNVVAPLEARPGSALGGHVVQFRPAEQDRSAEAQAERSLKRLADPSTSWVRRGFNILGGFAGFAVKFTASLVGAVGGAVVGGAAKLGRMVIRHGFKHISASEKARNDLRATLGQPTPGGVMSKTVPCKLDGLSVPNAAGNRASVSDLMEHYRQSLGGDKRISRAMMETYINMGERIVKALANPSYALNSGKLIVPMENGGGEAIHSTVDSTRAISWYLQAKALVDNADQNRPPAFLPTGTMVAKDPGHHLYNFLNRSKSTYGRISTHFAERSMERDASSKGIAKGWWKGGFFSGMGVAGGKPLQRGIEDFDKKMPSDGGGCLLFDKLAPETPDAAPEIMLKWEPVGTPNVVSFSQHGDDADGFANRMVNRFWAAKRNIGHTLEFMQNKKPDNYRGEKVSKGEAMQLFNSYEAFVGKHGAPDSAAMAKSAYKSAKKTHDAQVKGIMKDAKTYGVEAMAMHVDRLLDDHRQQHPAPTGAALGERRELERMRTEIAEFSNKMGADLGIARKGNEVHVRLSAAQ